MSNIEQYKENFDRNIERVRSLLKLYRTLKATEIKEGKDYKFTDVLRGATVMLHSSFEEYYRNIICFVLPKVCNPEDLKGISFERNNGNRKEKIELGDILEFRGRTVDDVIVSSITESLGYTSFNDFKDIARWAKRIKIDLGEFNGREKLGNLISRRHRIVHEADNSRGENGYSLNSIRENTVEEWVSVVCNLVDTINEEVEKMDI